MNSCIYTGQVGHVRYQPVVNRFRYSLFMMYLDLAELDHVFQGRMLWSVERPNLASFRRRDYLGDAGVPLDTAVRNLVREHLGKRPGGPIRLLTHLRYFGYIFNPVSFYYCFNPSGENVETIVAEITNTPWRERHSYVLDAQDSIGAGEGMRFRFAKSFHVSPFIGMNVEYDWRFSEPGDALRVRMTDFREGATLFAASLDLRRLELNGSNLAKMLASYPPMTLKTIAAIYWQAFKLKTKGAAFYTHPETRGES